MEELPNGLKSMKKPRRNVSAYAFFCKDYYVICLICLKTINRKEKIGKRKLT